MDSSDLYETREGDLELKGDVKPINYDVPSTEIGEIEKNDLETKELKGEELPINFEMTGPDVAVTEEISMPETEELITGRSVGEELDNSPIELSNDIVISEGENKIDFQQYSLKNIKDAEDEQDAVTLKQLNAFVPEISDGSITTNKLTDGAVTAAKIACEAIETRNLADRVVTNDKIGENAVTTTEIADEAVTTAKIGDVQVTSDKLASKAVTSEKIKWSDVKGNSYKGNDRFTSQQSSSVINLLSKSYTSKTGRICIIGNGYVGTSRYTSALAVYINDVEVSSSVTSSTSPLALTVFHTDDVGDSPITIALKARGQDSGTNAIVPGYLTYSLLIFDI